MNHMKRCQEFRKLLSQSCVMVPGAFNGLVARIVAQKGFQATYISGAALTASYGVPDIGLLTLDHFTCRIKEISLSSGLPIIADADTGWHGVFPPREDRRPAMDARAGRICGRAFGCAARVWINIAVCLARVCDSLFCSTA